MKPSILSPELFKTGQITPGGFGRRFATVTVDLLQ
jgi:hypothetical protein